MRGASLAQHDYTGYDKRQLVGTKGRVSDATKHTLAAVTRDIWRGCGLILTHLGRCPACPVFQIQDLPVDVSQLQIDGSRCAQVVLWVQLLVKRFQDVGASLVHHTLAVNVRLKGCQASVSSILRRQHIVSGGARHNCATCGWLASHGVMSIGLCCNTRMAWALTHVLCSSHCDQSATQYCSFWVIRAAAEPVLRQARSSESRQTDT